jgi:hypothetical protein
VAEIGASHADDVLLVRLAGAKSDPTGVTTFERFRWQTKQAVRLWLNCLTETSGPLFVVCEHVEDIVLVYRDRVRFLQLKTRDRGSWSATEMCGRGIDALVRSYNAALESGIHDVATFELWLEGPIADSRETIEFARSPRVAGEKLRKKIINQGLKAEHINDFLQRVLVFPNQPSRADVDAKALRELGAIWPPLSFPELEAIYERLLDAATAAQSAAKTPATIQAHLSAARPHLGDMSSGELPSAGSPLGDAIEPIRLQVLSLAMLTGLAPPRPGESAQQLLARISAGESASMLELKMTAAGASAQTIREAQALRADMEIERQLLLASRSNVEADLEKLETRCLSIAIATARRVSLSAATNPSAAARSADAIAAELLSRPSELAQCDRDLLFSGDGRLVYGFIGHLSDLCHFDWGAA